MHLFVWSLLASYMSPATTASLPGRLARLPWRPRPQRPPRPHIVLVVADDLGWNDVGWNNAAMKTPHLSRLAKHGVIMNSSYVDAVCSPSRAALLTGYYPFRMGLQSGVLRPGKPYGIPLEYELLPAKLKRAGYATHIVGKWHLGFCKWAYTPTYRGFDSFVGFYTGAGDYYNHTTKRPTGYDFRRDTAVLKTKRRYSTFTFARRAVQLINSHDNRIPLFLYLPFQAVHTPLQVPKKYEEMYSQVKNRRRRVYSGMVTAMDAAIGRVISALTRRRLIQNTLVIFLSDNGGSPYHSGGSNWPLRGGKSTLWEGGTRVPTLVWGKMLKRRGYVNNELIHAVDWLPTILEAAGIHNADRDRDGVSQWKTISHRRKSARKEFVYSINEVAGRAALRLRGFKLIEGNAGRYNERYHPERGSKLEHRRSNRINYHRANRTMLFNIDADPTEQLDVTLWYPKVVAMMKRRLAKYRTELLPANSVWKTRKSHPRFWGGEWSPGWC